MKLVRHIMIICLLPLLSACKDSSSSSTVSYDNTNATITSFSFAANDSMPGLAAAKFTVESLQDTGRIYLTDGDSILYGTKIDKVIPKIKYGGTPSAVICHLGDTSIALTNHDTLDFSKTPIKLHIYAADKKHEKWYKVFAPVHQADPDLYIWELLSAAITPAEAGEHKCLLASGRFFYFRSYTSGNKVAISEDGINWNDNNITGLTAICHCSQIQYNTIDKCFYYLDCNNNTLYHSSNAVIWQTIQLNCNGLTPLALWMYYDQELWTVLQSDTNKDSCYIATIDMPNNSYELKYRLKRSKVPVSDFATVVYQAKNRLEYALVAGGYNADGKMIADSWAFETSNNQYRIVNLHEGRTPTQPFAGSNIVWYNDRLMMYGGINSNYELNTSVYVSDNEGMTWTTINDTIHHLLPERYNGRWRMSTITNDNYIYLIGGQNKDTYFTDIYRGKLNSIDW